MSHPVQRRLTANCSMEFGAFPIPDRGVPDTRKAAFEFARSLAGRLGEGKAVAVHCRAGIGRSALIAAYVLGFLGVNADAAFKAIGAARGVPVPDTDQQRD